MKNSTATIEDKKMEVSLNVKGKDLLEKQNVNQYISKFISNTYGENLKVEFCENEIEKSEKALKDKNDKIIENYTRECIQNLMNNKKKTHKEEAENSSYENANGNVSMSFSENPSNLEEAPRTQKYQNSNAKGFQNRGNYNQNSNGQNGGYNNYKNYKKNTDEEKEPEETNPDKIYGRYNPKDSLPITKIEDIGMDTTNIKIFGEVVNVPDPTELKKTGKFLYSFDVYDGTSTITCKIFVMPDKKDWIDKNLSTKIGVEVVGKAGYDNFAKEITILANSVMKKDLPKKQERMDNAETKRVELHLHTQMSQMDAITLQ